jgi:hypothetical protein
MSVARSSRVEHRHSGLSEAAIDVGRGIARRLVAMCEPAREWKATGVVEESMTIEQVDLSAGIYDGLGGIAWAAAHASSVLPDVTGLAEVAGRAASASPH